jgi:hypothetical protein
MNTSVLAKPPAAGRAWPRVPTLRTIAHEARSIRVREFLIVHLLRRAADLFVDRLEVERFAGSFPRKV